MKKKPHIVYINLPGKTGEALEELLLVNSAIHTPGNARDLNEILNALPPDTDYLVYSGGHGRKDRPEMGGIDAGMIEADLPDKLRIFLFTCHQGNYRKAWARAHGIPVNHVFGISDKSYSYSSYRNIRKLMDQTEPVELVWLRQSIEAAAGHLLDKVKTPSGKTLRHILFG